MMYHQVGDFKPMDDHRANYCHYKRFKAQMHFLHRFGYSVISMDETVKCVAGQMRVPEKAVVLTFDDGYKNFFEYAYPVLRQYDFKATVYLVSGFLGGQATWFEDKRRDTPRLMDAERIRLLRREGIVFGSHGVSHARLSSIDPMKMEREISISKATLEDLIQEEISHFCYPYGDHNQLVADAVERAGYVSAVTCVRGAARGSSDPFILPRKAVSFGDNILGFLWKIHVKNQPGIKVEEVNRLSLM